MGAFIGGIFIYYYYKIIYYNIPKIGKGTFITDEAFIRINMLYIILPL